MASNCLVLNLSFDVYQIHGRGRVVNQTPPLWLASTVRALGAQKELYPWVACTAYSTINSPDVDALFS